ncbi:TIGR00341 family protein [Halalkalicoccus salilacus]|uniref:TIGR00341 family protein n=1 Tax=Halalkalicoccus salilacus TaxID=3117459 RepID=UPI00300F72AE
MRLVQVLVSEEQQGAIVDILDEEGIDFVLTEEASDRDLSSVISFPLPTPAVEPILSQLREVQTEEDSYVIVTEAETVVSQQFEELESRYERGGDPKDTTRIAREELFDRAEDMSPAHRTFLLLTTISSIVATTGLLLDSAAVVVGSMVIAPLLGPAIGTGVGTVLDNENLFREGVKQQAIGLVAAVAAATLFTLFVQATNLVPPGTDVLAISEISSRVSPDLLTLVIAIGAGIAGAWSLTAGSSEVLVGVMVAAALVPPLGVVGIGIAYGMPIVALSASVSVLVNVCAINIAGLGVFWYKGYRPTTWAKENRASRETQRRILVFILLTLVLSGFLGLVSYDAYRTSQFEQELRSDIPAAVEASTGADVELIDIEVQYDDPVPFQQPQRIVVTVSVPPGQEPLSLTDRIQQRADTRIQSSLHVPGFGPLLDSNQAEINVRYVLRETE